MKRGWAAELPIRQKLDNNVVHGEVAATRLRADGADGHWHRISAAHVGIGTSIGTSPPHEGRCSAEHDGDQHRPIGKATSRDSDNYIDNN